MSSSSLTNLSSTALYISFFLLLVAIIPFGLAVKSKGKLFSMIGVVVTAVGFILQLVYFVTRWMVAGHAPVSNLYEFMTFFAIMLVGSFLIMYYLYRQSVMGLFALPVALVILGYANAFSKEITPLIPALQSNWLTIHVLTVAFSSAVLSVAFVSGLIYLLKTVNPHHKRKDAFCLELVLYFLVVVVGFIAITSTSSALSYDKKLQFENHESKVEVATYKLPAITVPKNSEVVQVVDATTYKTLEQHNGMLELPASIDAQKLNTIIWSFLVGTVLYLLIRLLTKRNMISLLKPVTVKVNPQIMDEISYRAVVIGFPLFALGGLIFAMIWAQYAWSRFWGWDPKEVWALITFLFYAAMLHLRVGQGWEGKRTAWMSIIGFGLIIFNQVFVNLIIAGLHSYA